MYNLNVSKFSKKMESLGIDQLAIEKRFLLRQGGKVTPISFLLSFFETIIGKNYSLRIWSTNLSQLLGQVVSFQAIANKLQLRQLEFIKSLFHQVILKELKKQCQVEGLLNFFNRILVEDSSCVHLTSALYDAFPGASNQYGKPTATLRLQFRMDILNENVDNFDIKSYRDHDATYTDQLLLSIQKNDLILRDLAYYKGETLERIGQKGAYFISRYKPKTLLYTVDNEEPINLVKRLRKLNSQINTLDIKVKIKGINKYEIRLICFRLSEKARIKRIKKAYKKGNRNKKLTKETLYLCGWNILITNLSDEQFSSQNIYTLYSLRWSIELVFKTWKSDLQLQKILQSCQGPNPIKPKILAYLTLLFIVLVVNPVYKKYSRLVKEHFDRMLSPFKFFKNCINYPPFMNGKTDKMTLELIAKTCCYDKRNDRLNMKEKLMSII